MKDNIDKYKTILKQNEGELFKDKNSKFYGYAYPVDNENTVKRYLEELKKKHHTAKHWCYAYQIGTEQIIFRANDDGEPNNSAGMPIFGQIQSFSLTNILVVVVRYFGGVKLGVSGLINAYKTSAQLALTSATIIEKTINKSLQLKFEYKNLSKVLRLLKENNVEISKQVLEMDCLLEISVRKSNYQQLVTLFENFYGVETLEL
ncbi:IMPACT family protein [Winogradskyella alexanderae]|uniref:IMPACT family protein n=1 Tax=Winogradskyella alexanderae TaxID=2877123 RepID=A0ABS7XUJ2_9FLAO|nr:YigZ family protein [Winogradskyella alexanderae]MCA0133059.1 IMPACT family protein [Winogradskyella alexanderae]